MIELTSANNPIKWKRPVIGGLLSAAPAINLGGIVILPFDLPENFVGILYIVFGGLIALIYSVIPNIIAVVTWVGLNALLVLTAFVLCTWCQ